jgi:hypothetical protein
LLQISDSQPVPIPLNFIPPSLAQTQNKLECFAVVKFIFHRTA